MELSYDSNGAQSSKGSPRTKPISTPIERPSCYRSQSLERLLDEVNKPFHGDEAQRLESNRTFRNPIINNSEKGLDKTRIEKGCAQYTSIHELFTNHFTCDNEHFCVAKRKAVSDVKLRFKKPCSSSTRTEFSKQ